MGFWLPRQISLRRATTARASSLSSCVKQHLRSGFLQLQYSTTSAPPAKYGYIHGVEDLSDYQPGGYHPIHINDRLHKRYRIVHKLGYGTFSTAWLAIDEKTTKYVAIKLGTADADRTEIDMLSQITQSPESRSAIADNPLLPAILDRFEVSGPNGTHPCLMTLPARCSLQDAKEASGSALFQLDVARSLAAQLVMAMSLVHASGYAHGAPLVDACMETKRAIGHQKGIRSRLDIKMGVACLPERFGNGDGLGKSGKEIGSRSTSQPGPDFNVLLSMVGASDNAEVPSVGCTGAVPT